MKQKIQCFLAGIIQGSFKDDSVHAQNYREIIKSILTDAYPDMNVYCPFENHQNSVAYSDKRARQVFFDHLEMVRKSDLLVVFVPQASMGSAIEMWEAHHHNTVVITITPMQANWVVRLLSDYIFSDIKDFKKFIMSKEMQLLIL